MFRISVLALSLLCAPVFAAAPTGDERGAESAAELLKEAKRLYTNLEYDKVLPLAERVLANPDINVEQRLDAYLLQGSCLAIIGNTVDAEKPFRFLLRGRPSYDMGPQTPPRILQVFRKVQVEEQAIQTQMRELEREKMIASMTLGDPKIDDQRGGQPVSFNYAIRDPRGAARSVSVLYRKRGARDFSSLALTQGADGRWRGEIPGEWTANDEGFTLEYVVKTADEQGLPLVAAGTEASPLSAKVDPGQVGEGGPFYTSGWFWSATTVAVLALAGTAATVGYFNSQPPPGDIPPINIDP